MKKLYISDLDGTLLPKNVTISEYTKNVLQKFINDGNYFSVATARTAASVGKIMPQGTVNMPCVLMNGVCVWDMQKQEYLLVNNLPQSGLEKLINTIHKYNLAGFLYCIKGGQLHTLYENLNSPNAEKFMQERVNLYAKPFTKVEDFALNCDSAVYYSLSDKKEKLQDCAKALKECEDLHIEFYKDVYDEDFWYLEVCSNKASKKNAVDFLRKTYNFDEITGFGDNLNDIPLFNACDKSYAVKNARQEIKDKADAIIDANFDDGVAKFLNKI